MGRFLVVAPGYPDDQDRYNNGFVHILITGQGDRR
jgi:hypothetical protein